MYKEIETISLYTPFYLLVVMVSLVSLTVMKLKKPNGACICQFLLGPLSPVKCLYTFEHLIEQFNWCLPT